MGCLVFFFFITNGVFFLAIYADHTNVYEFNQASCIYLGGIYLMKGVILLAYFLKNLITRLIFISTICSF